MSCCEQQELPAVHYLLLAAVTEPVLSASARADSAPCTITHIEAPQPQVAKVTGAEYCMPTPCCLCLQGARPLNHHSPARPAQLVWPPTGAVTHKQPQRQAVVVSVLPALVATSCAGKRLGVITADVPLSMFAVVAGIDVLVGRETELEDDQIYTGSDHRSAPLYKEPADLLKALLAAVLLDASASNAVADSNDASNTTAATGGNASNTAAGSSDAGSSSAASSQIARMQRGWDTVAEALNGLMLRKLLR